MDANIDSRLSHNLPPQKGGHFQLAASAGSGRRKQLAERRVLGGAVADIIRKMAPAGDDCEVRAWQQPCSARLDTSGTCRAAHTVGLGLELGAMLGSLQSGSALYIDRPSCTCACRCGYV